jgi:hypothetical protein
MDIGTHSRLFLLADHDDLQAPAEDGKRENINLIVGKLCAKILYDEHEGCCVLKLVRGLSKPDLKPDPS